MGYAESRTCEQSAKCIAWELRIANVSQQQSRKRRKQNRED